MVKKMHHSGVIQADIDSDLSEDYEFDRGDYYHLDDTAHMKRETYKEIRKKEEEREFTAANFTDGVDY